MTTTVTYPTYGEGRKSTLAGALYWAEQQAAFIESRGGTIEGYRAKYTRDADLIYKADIASLRFHMESVEKAARRAGRTANVRFAGAYADLIERAARLFAAAGETA